MAGVFLHLLTNFCVQMKLIRRVMHERAHIKGKIITFQIHESQYWGSVKRDFGEFSFWYMFECCCGLSSIV